MGQPSAVEIDARFNTLVDRFAGHLRGAIARFCPPHLGLDHADIEQEARIRLWRALKSGTEIRDYASYIYKVAATATIDAIRRVKARREEQLGTAEEDDEGERVPLPAALAADRRAGPDQVAERRQMAEKVKAVFARLDAKRRNAVVLHLEGLTTEEIARSQHWSEPKARHLVYRGMNDLRRHLKAEGIDCEID